MPRQRINPEAAQLAIVELQELLQKYEKHLRDARAKQVSDHTTNYSDFTYLFADNASSAMKIQLKLSQVKGLKKILADTDTQADKKLESFISSYETADYSFAKRRSNDTGISLKFWKAVDTLLKKFGFGPSTMGVTGATVDKKINGIFERPGIAVLKDKLPQSPTMEI